MQRWILGAILLIPFAAAHGANGFESSPVNPGASFSQQFEETGLIEYECEIHPFMTGTIRIGAASATPTEHHVKVLDGEVWGFDPQSLTIAAGDTVTWTNAGSDTHALGGNLPGANQESPGFAGAALIATLLVGVLLRR